MREHFAYHPSLSHNDSFEFASAACFTNYNCFFQWACRAHGLFLYGVTCSIAVLVVGVPMHGVVLVIYVIPAALFFASAACFVFSR